MAIKSYNRINSNTVRQLNRIDSISSASSGEYVVSRVDPVKEVESGFNATSLYLAKVYKDLKEKSKSEKNSKIKDMTFDEFVFFFNDVKDDYISQNYNISENLSREQILLMQDVMTSFDNVSKIFRSDRPIIMLDDINAMSIEQFRVFLMKHEEVFSNSGLFHSNDNIDEMNDDDIFNLKELLIIKIRDIQDLFYYNKAFDQYEKSYNNMAYFESDGINI